MSFIHTCTFDTDVYMYIGISLRIMEIVFRLVNALFCVTYWNISVVQITKRRTSPVFAFYMPIPDQVESLVVFCMSKVNTGLMHPLTICTIYVQIYSHKQIQKSIHYSQNSTFTRQNTCTPCSIILEFISMYTLLSEVHVYINAIRVAQSVEHRTTDLRVVGSNSIVGKYFWFCILSLSTRIWQVD